MSNIRKLIFDSLDKYTYESNPKKDDNYYKNRLERAFDRAFKNLKGINVDHENFNYYKKNKDEMI